LLRVLGGIEVRQLNEAAKHTPLYGDVESLEQKLALPPHFNGRRAAPAELVSRRRSCERIAETLVRWSREA
jgi:hypothetical protein